MANEIGSSTISDILQSKAGLAAIIVALTSLMLIKPSPLNSERPTVEPGGSKSYGAPQDVDARLWQDPFQAVNDATKNTATDRLEIKGFDGNKFTVELAVSKTQNTHSPEDIFRELPDASDCDQITLMAVMMSASPTPEAREMRLRRRYALVSALATKRFVPVDAEHIGYYKTNDQNLPGIVPFEWFEKPSRKKPAKGCDGTVKMPSWKVLVLWVDDTRFDRMPVMKTINLFNQLTTTRYLKNKGNIARIVMGPSTSDNLRAMALEADNRGKMFDSSKDGKIKYFSSQATSADSELLKGIPDQNDLSISKYLADKEIWLNRTIADDRTVVGALVKELEIRHVKDDIKGDGDSSSGNESNNHIVLLSDWDTFYGRALPLTFKSDYDDEEKARCHTLDLKKNIHCFKYVRGIDGILPGASPNSSKEQSRSTKSESSSDTAVSDQPEGMSQKDYLRRIVVEIRKLDERLQNDKACISKCGVTSIGVLGYDVYDKLMILRALRPYFPSKVFFTTDLSASYWSPAELPFTHNLIVASSFGLSLNPDLQKDIPPFRDSYQTSLFLSVILALENNAQDEDNFVTIPGLDKPRIFEIGRNGPIDLGNPDAAMEAALQHADTSVKNQLAVAEGNSSAPEATKASAFRKTCAFHVSNCSTIHPSSIFEQAQESHKTLTRLILAICSFVLLYLASWNVRKWVNNLFFKNEDVTSPSTTTGIAHRLHWKRIWIFLCLLLIIFATSVLIKNPAYNKEPWLWFEGVSVWPSELLRLIALVISLMLIQDVLQKISKSNDKISTAFGFKENGENEQPLPGFWTTLRLAISSLSNCPSILKWQSKATLKELYGQAINVNEIWNEYRQLGEPKRRVCRSLLGIAPFAVFAGASIVLTGGMTSPVRGDFAYYADSVLTIPVWFLMLFLTVLVIDASRLNAALILYLDDNQSDWLTGTKNSSCAMIQLSNTWGLKSEHTAYWLDVQFIAERTEAIQKLIWYPLIPIFLLVVAKSPVFDDWSHPVGLIATLIMLLFYLITCAFLLEYGAKQMRGKASEQLGAELRTLRGSSGSSDNPEIKRLENLIREIDVLKRGAFLPLFQQPWVEAILALASGAGGLAWMGSILGTP